MNNQPIPRQQIDAMYAYYREGHSTRQTARKFGVSCSTVNRCFHRCGYPVRSRIHAMLMRQRAKDDAPMIYREWRDGTSTRALADKYNYTQSGIWKKIRRFRKTYERGQYA